MLIILESVFFCINDTKVQNIFSIRNILKSKNITQVKFLDKK